MLQDNVEVVRSLLDAWSRRDVDAVLERLRDDVEWRPALTAGGIEGTVYRGHRDMRNWFRELDDVWAELSQQVDQVRDLGGGRVLMLGRFHAVGREGGVPIDQPHGILFTVEGDKVATGRAFASTDEALAAAGLLES